MNNENLYEVLGRIVCFLREEKTNKTSCDFGFNIFEAAGISTKEVFMCNVLANLINPNGAHGQKYLYLDLFFKYVLNATRLTKKVIVHTEWPTENGRWIDIVIEDGQRVIPIEVKINARDQKNQCADYSVYAKESSVYYLTADGHMPSDYSIGNLTEDEIMTKIKPIAWETSVIKWLNACIEATEDEYDIVLMHLQQFISAVKKFCLFAAMSKHMKSLDINRRDKIKEVLQEVVRKRGLDWTHLNYGFNTQDDGINYFIGESGDEFFRVLCEGGVTKAGKIVGLNNSTGNGEKWVFGGREWDKKRKEKYGNDVKWWLCEEIIVPYNKFHLLFDDDYLEYYVDRIVELYEKLSCDMCGDFDYYAKFGDLFSTLEGIDLPIEEFDLPVSCYNFLKQREIYNLKQLLSMSADDIMRTCTSNQQRECCYGVIGKLLIP